MKQESLGMIGLGLLGSALAYRFLQTGYEVIGYDVSAEARDQLSKQGGTPSDSGQEVFDRCRKVILCLPDSRIVSEVIHGATLRSDHFLLDTTTGDPDETATLGKELKTKGIVYIDATILGSSEQTRVGDVIVMAGGDPADIAAADDILSSFARQRFHVGEHGAGAQMKLIVNLVLGLNRAVLAEGLALAKRVGMDPAKTLEVLRSGAAYSRVMDVKGAKMVNGDFRTQAKLAQHLKDVRLILQEASRAGAKTPLTQTHEGLLQQLVDQGLGDEDNSVVIRGFE